MLALPACNGREFRLGVFGWLCCCLAAGLAAVGRCIVAVGLCLCGLRCLVVVVLRLGEEVAEYVLDYFVYEDMLLL